MTRKKSGNFDLKSMRSVLSLDDRKIFPPLFSSFYFQWTREKQYEEMEVRKTFRQLERKRQQNSRIAAHRISALFASLLQCAAAFTKQTVFRTVARASKDYSNWRESQRSRDKEYNKLEERKRSKKARKDYNNPKEEKRNKEDALREQSHMPIDHDEIQGKYF